MTDIDHPIAVEMRGVTKLFPGVVANKEVNLSIRRGEIHALLGENGAGKSTLMSVLCGLYHPDEGEIWLTPPGERQLRPVRIHSPGHAFDLGIGMVHQHFKLVQTQSVAENVILGLKGTKFLPDMAKVESNLHELSDRYHLPVHPKADIWQLSVGEQQRVEILKVLYRGANILILDEPTAVLTPQEADELGAIMRNMANEGKAIIFISHKLDEIMAYADRVTVLRKGMNVATLNVSQTSKTELAQLMVGRDVLFRIEKDPPNLGDVVLEMANVGALNNRGIQSLRDVSLTIRSGEIMGIAGVAGNGQRELSEVVTGMRRVTGGHIYLRGEDVTNQPPIIYIQRGVAHVPGDRLGVGLAGNLSVSDNLIMKTYNRAPIAAGALLNHRLIRDFAARLVQAFDVLTPNLETHARNLSGGNQQKAILAREITTGKTRTSGDEAPFLVTAYPTRGLDVGAIETVRRELLEQRAQGTAIMLISEQLEELLVMSDRIAVLHGGEIMGIVDAATATVEELGLMMAGERSH